MEEHSELCLAEEVERLRASGLSDEEIAERMGVDPAWVESLTAMFAPEATKGGREEG